MIMRTSPSRAATLTLLAFLGTSLSLAGGIAVVSTSLSDNGDNDGYADSHETVTLHVTLRNASGGPLTNVTATLYGLQPDLACTTQPQIAIGNLATGQTVTPAQGFEFTVSDVDRTTLGLGPFDPLTADFRIYFDSDSGPVRAHSPKITLDLDLDISGGSGTGSFFESFENMNFGAFEIQNLDNGLSSIGASDGYRCQYNDPDNSNSNAPGRTNCHLAPNPAHASATWWQLSGPSFSPAGGRGFSGFHSLFFGVDLGPPENWTTPMAVLEAVRMTDPVHIDRNAPDPALTFKHQVSLADGRVFSLPPAQTYDRGVVMVQVADDQGNPAGPWIKVDPYQNPYDQQNAPIIINCGFDPVDDGNTEDDYFAPGDPRRRTGPSSTCWPEFIFAHMGESTEPFAAANVGRADGPGLQGLWGIGTWVETKVDLSRFRGRSVRARFVATSLEANPNQAPTWDSLFGGINPITGDDGWWIDDVEFSGLVVVPATVAVDNQDNSGLPGAGGPDGDSDGTLDTCDNCPATANLGQQDGDTDQLGDACDICPYNVINVDPDADAICGPDDNCPETSNPAQTDDDNDGFGAACDCNDNDFTINPNGIEVNNGLDDDCDTAVDEISGVLIAKGAGQVAQITWDAQAFATKYEVARSESPTMAVSCASFQAPSPSYDEPLIPIPGGVLYFTVRAKAPNIGSWGLDSGNQERFVPCAP